MTIKKMGGIFGRNPTFNEVTIDGAITANGNIVMANGKGIDFSATAGTGTSELFNDYEEGTWTPTLVGNTSAGTYN
jgi:filamentous hemagglutinin family protein